MHEGRKKYIYINKHTHKKKSYEAREKQQITKISETTGKQKKIIKINKNKNKQK